ncbi:MAG: molybdenum cofactor guanylyltransferase [bacterium]|nr:molybdenum cofactor guanylyltransferase [Candidatus Margulisiibacteriota bacterium]
MVNAIVLAGGRSSRFGSDKAFAKIGDSTIVESLFFPLFLIFKKVVVVTNFPEKYQDFPVQIVQDKIKNRGPLAGIYSGLLASDTERNFIVACDMPLLNPRLIKYLISIQEGQVVIPRIKEKLEPLHAVYTRSCLPAIKQQLIMGDNKIQNFFDKVNTRFVEEEDVRKFDPTLTSFLNINLQKDLRKIKGLVHQRSGGL